MDQCDGFFCDPQKVAAVLVLGLICLLLLYALIRMLVVNARRRSLGLDPIGFGDVVNRRMSTEELQRADADTLHVHDELQRQMDWEKEQAGHELIRTGQHIKRQFCKVHQRWCFHAWEADHPSGGFDNPTVPDDWPPDLTMP